MFTQGCLLYKHITGKDNDRMLLLATDYKRYASIGRWELREVDQYKLTLLQRKRTSGSMSLNAQLPKVLGLFIMVLPQHL